MSKMKRTKFLQPEEIASLKQDLKLINTRDRLLIELALATGARASELLALKKQDLTSNPSTVFIRGLKNSEDREIPVPVRLFKEISLLAQKPEDRLFPIGYQRLVQIWNTVRPNRKVFHSLRHTFALELYRRCKDIRVVQQALGHKSMISTEVYSTYEYSVTELRKAMGI